MNKVPLAFVCWLLRHRQVFATLDSVCWTCFFCCFIKTRRIWDGGVECFPPNSHLLRRIGSVSAVSCTTSAGAKTRLNDVFVLNRRVGFLGGGVWQHSWLWDSSLCLSLGSGGSWKAPGFVWGGTIYPEGTPRPEVDAFLPVSSARSNWCRFPSSVHSKASCTSCRASVTNKIETAVIS